MGITRKLLELSDRKFEEACNENKSGKTFLSGVIEGFMDGAVLMYVPVLIAIGIAHHKNTKKEK